MSHLPRDVGQMVVDRVFDDRADVQLRPDLQARSPLSGRRLDLLAKSALDAAGVG